MNEFTTLLRAAVEAEIELSILTQSVDSDGHHPSAANMRKAVDAAWERFSEGIDGRDERTNRYLKALERRGG